MSLFFGKLSILSLEKGGKKNETKNYCSNPCSYRYCKYISAPLAQLFAAENDKDITGTWTGSSMGIPMEMTVNDDGTYQISVDGGNKETGSWVLKDKDFIMDMDSDYELNMKYNGDSIFVDSSDIDIGFCKTQQT